MKKRKILTYCFFFFRKRWYEQQQNMIESTTDWSKSILLTLSYIPFDEYYDLLLMDIEQILRVTPIYHVETFEKMLFIGILIHMINTLPELNTIKIYSLSLDLPRKLTTEELMILESTKTTSKITKVYLGEIFDIREINFLFKLCPYMSFLHIDSMKNMDIYTFKKDILDKINHDSNEFLRLLCIHIPTVNNQMFKNLQVLFSDYIATRIDQNIYLQWK